MYGLNSQTEFETNNSNMSATAVAPLTHHVKVSLKRSLLFTSKLDSLDHFYMGCMTAWLQVV